MKLKVCAKLNLSLDISAARSDGYHNMRMVMQSVDLCDTLTVDFNRGDDITVKTSTDIEGENIAKSAVIKYSEEAGFKIGGTIHIEKQIPICGGMGGGSADAAAVLFALDKTFRAVSKEKLEKIALSLGADVPFAMVGGTRLAEGVGEVLTEISPLPYCEIVLCCGGKKESTGSMFRQFDGLKNQLHPDVDGVADMINKGNLEQAAKLVANSFEPLWNSQLMADIGACFEAHGCLGHALSGAGSTVFGIFSDKAKSENCKKELEELTGWAQICHPTEKAIYIIE